LTPSFPSYNEKRWKIFKSLINNFIGLFVDSLDNILFTTIMAAFHWAIESIKNAVISAQVFTYIKITK